MNEMFFTVDLKLILFGVQVGLAFLLFFVVPAASMAVYAAQGG